MKQVHTRVSSWTNHALFITLQSVRMWSATVRIMWNLSKWNS